MRRALIPTAFVLAAAAVTGAAGISAAQAPARPDVAGQWTGTWGEYVPPGKAEEGKKKSPYERAQMRLDCTVKELSDGQWEATFEGECGRPYKYTIKMLGRQAGKAVLFKGTADLGEKDGGVYDWIGRANDKEFLGFYTSQGHHGTFTLARVPK